MMSPDLEPLVTVYILVRINYEDGTQIGPFTQSFDVPYGTDVAVIDDMAAETAYAFLDKYPRYGLAGEGEATPEWEITAPLMYQYSPGD
jgi:hypothetical protein